MSVECLLTGKGLYLLVMRKREHEQALLLNKVQRAELPEYKDPQFNRCRAECGLAHRSPATAPSAKRREEHCGDTGLEPGREFLMRLWSPTTKVHPTVELYVQNKDHNIRNGWIRARQQTG